MDWAQLKPEKDIGAGWFEKGIEAKGSSGGGKCPDDNAHCHIFITI